MRIKKLNPSAVVPTRATSSSAGYDLYACLETDGAIIHPGKTMLIGTGIAAEVPEGYFGGVFARSGLASKKGLRPANCVGVVDSDYRGEIKVALHNDSDVYRVIKNGDRIAQLVVIPYFAEELEVVETLDDTERGAGGFGSTGK